MELTHFCALLFIVPVAVLSQQQLDSCGEREARGVFCEEGKVCRLVEVTCESAPCPPVPMCVSATTPHPDANRCTLFTCPEGYVCDVANTLCLPETPDCSPHPICIPATNPLPNANPCTSFTCPGGSVCEVAYPNCVTNAPNCGPYATCIPTTIPLPNANQCTLFTCPEEYVCDIANQRCLAKIAECSPYPTCIPATTLLPNANPCTSFTCPEGSVCEVAYPNCITNAPNCGPFATCILTGAPTSRPQPQTPPMVTSGPGIQITSYCAKTFPLPKFFCQWIVPECMDDRDCLLGSKCCFTEKCGRKGCLLARLQPECSFIDKIFGLCK